VAKIKMKGNTVRTVGELPNIGEQINDFVLVKNDLSRVSLSEFKGKKLVFNIFPSIETRVCSASVRQFNKLAAELENTLVLSISRDLPFALNRFCGAEGIENVITLSDFDKGKFGRDYGLEILDGPFQGLLSRAVIVTDENGIVVYNQQVPDIGEEPDYVKALELLK
jgi:thiol peroxidase